ncbi:hypothetical protein [Gloeothece citriformis]|nr:hypothetical protein [Gloeothece citriformis]
MAQAEGIPPSKLWINRRLVCSYLITFSIANATKNLENGEKALIKFPADVEFMIKKENGQVKVNSEHLAWMLGHDIETFPFSQMIK